MKKLLLVDDEKDLLLSLSEYLNARGFQTIGAQSAQDAQTFLKKETPDLILSDLKMPHMTGLELLSYCQNLGLVGPGKSAFVLMTSYADIVGAEKALQLGVSDLISKPFDFSSLEITINHVLSLPASVGSTDDEYFAVPVEEFKKLQSALEVRIYLKIASKQVLIGSSQQAFTSERLSSFLQRGIEHVYLSAADYVKYVSIKLSQLSH